MTTTTLPAAALPRDLAGPTLGRLVTVELRKASNTRSGRWLLLSTALVAVVVAGLRAFIGPADDRTLTGVIELALIPCHVLLPILGILLVTSEWSQRTALTTFALVPDRRRVVGAKMLAALAIALAGLLATVVVSALGVAIAGVDGAWDLGVADAGQVLLAIVLNTLWGLAFGLVLRSPAAAIVGFFILPTVFTVLGELVPGLESTWEWLDPNIALTNLNEMDITTEGWWQLLTSGTMWIALPLVAGTVFLLRREVK